MTVAKKQKHPRSDVALRTLKSGDLVRPNPKVDADGMLALFCQKPARFCHVQDKLAAVQ
jgi:hypothetical protein